MSRYRILYVDHGAKLVGGGQANILSLIRCLDKDLFEPIIVTSKENSFTEQAKNLGIHVDAVSYPVSLTSTYRNKMGLSPGLYVSYLFGLVGIVWRLSKYILNNKINLVHPCDNISRVAGGIAARLNGVPAVCHITDDLEDTFVNRVLRRVIFWGMDRILPVSDKVGAFFRKDPRYVSRVQTVYTGIDLDYFSGVEVAEDARKELGISAGELVIGIVGLLVPIKGHKELFGALARIKKLSVLKFKCLVVGDGPDRTRLEALAGDLGISNEVIFTGFKDDVVKTIAVLDIIAVPSHTEASSRVVLEAGALGIPAVGTRVGGIPEMIQGGGTGLLVELGNIEALADAIVRLSDEKLRTEMGESARMRVKEVFCNRKITMQIQKVYESLLKTNKNGQTN